MNRWHKNIWLFVYDILLNIYVKILVFLCTYVYTYVYKNNRLCKYNLL